ncbi:MAG TPA: hypothetical protein VK106_02860 [Balneolaceae bacterium]|nr:hypothetical protein [Balneolaceae bacterium]
MAATIAFRKFAVVSVILGVAATAIIAFATAAPAAIFLIPYLICFVLAGSNFLLMNKIDTADNKTFFAWFGGSFAVRFLGAVMAVILGVELLNSYEILFTVSFLFSYLCLSTIEIIYLNSILKTDA